MTSFLVSPTDPNVLATIQSYLAASKGRALRIEKGLNVASWARIQQAAFEIVKQAKYTTAITPTLVTISKGGTKGGAKRKKTAAKSDKPKRKISKKKSKK
jgi:hypothetical protein